MYVAFTIHSPVYIHHPLTVITLKKKKREKKERFEIQWPGITVIWGQLQKHVGERRERKVV